MLCVRVHNLHPDKYIQNRKQHSGLPWWGHVVEGTGETMKNDPGSPVGVTG